MSMVALDLETTGLDIRQDKIIEIGMIRFDGSEILETYQTFVNPDRPIPPTVTQLTQHIQTQKLVFGRLPLFFK